MAKKVTKKLIRTAPAPFAVGDPVFMRTVTHYYIGRVIAINLTFGPGFLTLEAASWVADTGRFSEALKNGRVNESEPFPASVSINLASIIDVTWWSGPLPYGVN